MYHPILFTIGGVNFYSYGFFVAMAFLATYGVFAYLYNKNKLSDKYLFEKLLLVLLAGFLGARIVYFALYHQEFSNAIDFFRFWLGGYVSFGGIVGGFIALIVIFRKKLLSHLDIFGVSFMAGAALWRIGCFMAHDHAGVFTTAWYAINYEAPAILFEIILSLIGFIIFFILYTKKIIKTPGIIFFAMFAYYGTERIFTDIFRDDPIIWGLRTGQWAGIVMLIVGVSMIIYLKFIKKSKENYAKIKR